MTAELLVLDLSCVAGGAPVVLDGGHMDRGRRSLSGSLAVPGRIGQCRFARLRVDVKETFPGSGEWHVWGQRVATGARDYHWEGLTDLARKALTVDVSRQVRASGFDDAWLAAFTARDRYEEPALEAERCRRFAEWWDGAQTLEAFLRDGLLTVIPVRPDGNNQRPRVDVVGTHDGRVSWEEVAARLEGLTGDLRGWVSDSGRLVPLVELGR